MNKTMKMKKSALIWIISAIALPLQAQIGWNIKAGVGASDLKRMDIMNAAFSYKVGVGADIPLNNRWALQPTLYFSAKGAGFDGYYGSEQIYEAQFKNRLHYLELPVCIAFKINLEQATSLIIKAGPYLGYGLSGKASVKTPVYNDFHQTFGENLFSEACTYNAISYIDGSHTPIESPSYKRLDSGITAGADLCVSHLLLGIESSWGLTPVAGNFMEKKPKNFAACFMVGYRF